MRPVIVRTVAELRAMVRGWKAEGAAVGVVPTMGALHDGHLSLVRAAQRDCKRVIVTIFVNPKQFNSADDLAKYPRTEAADAALLAPLGVDAIFAPMPDEVYPEGFATNVSVGGISTRLEGLHRPGHFDGVATVVTKLFGMTLADRAYFGEKDWQQLQVVRRLVADLNLPVEIVGCPTIREPDNLARSSRNVRLSPEARTIASALPREMAKAAGAMRAGGPVHPTLDAAKAALLAAGFDEVEYIDLCDAETLLWIDELDGPGRLLAAAWVGGVRLIDNIAV
ncbi:pantoate--beta-alanine ligase [Tabrizicola sp. J26]|uniref:pantoate--beta-alanine ligase n=1 Tax=Alitabrizicola rongguiensis TaxID=2909234 RepID=UPI001F1E507A|nr:pantoate--beta-alanine ligase [Tabrizicola rongguiensis]MCF1707797.1 pantoate--beta-alanine ligase [Tabrizicola rongguiensis]